MRQPTEAQLLNIAQKHISIPTLETRNMDSLDFHEVSVGAIRRALIAAYELGYEMRDWQED